MEKLKNQTGSTMLVTMSLIALFGIFLTGFHTAILASTTRVDGTYSQKQTYLYSRSAVTALAEELMAVNAEYDQAWQAYCDALDAMEEGDAEPERPEKPPLLAAVDGLTPESPRLELSSSSLGNALVDDYDLELAITRVEETADDGTTAVAYKLTGTTVINGIREISDTMSILLSTSGKKLEITQESVGGEVEGGEESEGGSFSGIYTDNEFIFAGWNEKKVLPTGINGGSTIVGGGDMVYDLHGDINNGEENILWMIDGDLTLTYTDVSAVHHVDFYVDGDLTINGTQDMNYYNCNFYVSGDVKLVNTPEWPVGNFENCTIQCHKLVSEVSQEKTTMTGTTLTENANVDAQIAQIPQRPKPAWVDPASESTGILYTGEDAKNEVPITAGNVYRLDTDVGLWYKHIEDNMVGDATPENPITIIVGNGVSVGVHDPCGPNVRFLVEPGGELTVMADHFYADVYAYPPQQGKTDAYVFYKGIPNFTGTIIVPTLTLEGHNNYHYGGGGVGSVTPPVITTETIEYNLYTKYIYVRG